MGKIYNEQFHMEAADNIEYYYALYLHMLRMDAEDEGRWITVNGTHIHLNEEGEADKGPNEVKQVINGPKKTAGSKAGNAPKSTQSHVIEQPQKSKVNASINELVDKIGSEYSYEDSKELAKILDSLEPGSVVTVPERYGDKSYRYKMDEYGDWVLVGGLGFGGIRSEDLAGEFFLVDKADRAYVSKSAMSFEDIQKANESLKTWRNKESAWATDKPLDETETVTMYAADINSAGDGITAVGKDGTEYISYGNGVWRNTETNDYADNSELKGAKFSGDYYETTFGLNGMSKSNVKYLKETIANMPDSEKKMYEDAFRQHPVNLLPKNSEDGAYYKPSTGEVFISTDSTPETIIHEFAHASEFGIIDKDIKETWGGYHIGSASVNIDHLYTEGGRNDLKAFCDVVGLKVGSDGWFSDDLTSSDIRKKTWEWCAKNHLAAGFERVSDAISGLTQDETALSFHYGGHKKSYWMKPYSGQNGSPRSTEYWANYLVLKANGNNEALSLLKQVTPGMYAAAEKTFEEAFGNGK